MPAAALDWTRPAAEPAPGRVPGNRGIWVGICCEFVEFLVLFVTYFVARAHHPEAFRAGAERLGAGFGLAITVVMVSSSYCLARAVASIRAGALAASRRWLVAALVVAAGYPLTKLLEIDWNLAHGIDGGGGIFAAVYYYLTINHMVHAGWGMLGMLWVLFRHLTGAYTAADHDGLEALASYWHATDIIWLTLFPFFYVLV
ncbi:MAG: cytochrome c oxidase subunit 3 family protein [Rhodocyclaceae bacterium]|nr:cytochrome c oxidase subunit 3 family protein [Rhodocyclaceae bacterium]